jgi:2-polyprenyl-3-methyl-5-hydroxy-6-metoxy-1,4-benzoquinol methylase
VTRQHVVKEKKISKSEEFWDKASGNYDKTEDRFEYIHSKSRNNTKKYLKRDDVVLDYGCGTGTASCEFASLVKEIHAIDISSQMIEIAREKAFAGSIENVSFLQADIFDKRYERESFDVILAFNMLHTVPNPNDVISRIYELLKPEGLFISVTPCLRQRMSFLVSAQIQLVRVFFALRIITNTIIILNIHEIDNLLMSENFQTVESEDIFKGASSYFVAARKI